MKSPGMENLFGGGQTGKKPPWGVWIFVEPLIECSSLYKV